MIGSVNEVDVVVYRPREDVPGAYAGGQVLG
jgi:hypothetical protein